MVRRKRTLWSTLILIFPINSPQGREEADSRTLDTKRPPSPDALLVV